MNHFEIVLTGLPKISLNQWYSGSHWSKRKKIKDDYYWIIKDQTKHVFPRNKKYRVDYQFFFKNNPLDASNTIGLVKMVEDTLFESDKYDIVTKISMSSCKGTEDKVIIKVEEYE